LGKGKKKKEHEGGRGSRGGEPSMLKGFDAIKCTGDHHEGVPQRGAP